MADMGRLSDFGHIENVNILVRLIFTRRPAPTRHPFQPVFEARDLVLLDQTRLAV